MLPLGPQAERMFVDKLSYEELNSLLRSKGFVTAAEAKAGDDEPHQMRQQAWAAMHGQGSSRPWPRRLHRSSAVICTAAVCKY